jgi:SAM-dependent methyltransferase
MTFKEGINVLSTGQPVSQSRLAKYAPIRRSAVLSHLPVRPSDFVVEIGAGPAPFSHTKLILDKFPFENAERHGDIVRVAPIIKADAVKLPLADKACDVLFVSHVIEHIPDPARFIEEAKRCARYIYLEFPSALRELMYSWSFHRWLVEVEDGQLIFYRNDIPQLFGDFFHTHYDFLFDLWSEYRFAELNTYLYLSTDDLTYSISPKTALERVLERSRQGEGRINFPSQYGEIGMGKVAYAALTRLKMLVWTLLPDSLIRTRNRITQRLNRSEARKLSGAIVDRLLCQRCRAGSLRMENGAADDEIVCNSCAERYRATDGVFDFDI